MKDSRGAAPLRVASSFERSTFLRRALSACERSPSWRGGTAVMFWFAESRQRFAERAVRPRSTPAGTPCSAAERGWAGL